MKVYQKLLVPKNITYSNVDNKSEGDIAELE